MTVDGAAGEGRSLKQQKLIFLNKFLEAGSPKSRCWQGHPPSRGSREDPSCLFQLRVALGSLGSWPHPLPLPVVSPDLPPSVSLLFCLLGCPPHWICLFIFIFKLLSFKKHFIELQLIYNVVLISAIQPSQLYIYTFFFIFFSIMVYYRILNVVPCAVQ